jgi:hypothetical protein
MKAIKSWCALAVTLIVAICAQSATFGANEVTPLGIWEGKWDETWKVRFTISKGEKSPYKVFYEWEEHSGEPMSKMTIENTQFKDGSLEIGKTNMITIEFKDDGSAVAKGNFKKPRTAILKKQSSTKP